MSQIGCPYEPKFGGNASRVYTLDQKYRSHGKNRANNKMTKSIEIALEEHRIFHIEEENFPSIELLNRHMELMLDAMLSGMDFNQAHIFALQNM